MLSALVRQPGAVRFDLVAEALATMRATQSAEGRWPSSDGSATFSVWSVAPFLDALADARTYLPLRAGRLITPLSRHTAVIQGGSDLQIAPERLLIGVRGERIRLLARRRWAAGALLALIATGVVLLGTGALAPRELAFGLLVPVVLLVLQLSIGRSRRQQPDDG
ncbi:hypothetical protein SAMN05421812_104543 [Asanoa hainanensis]|uniref:Uncharacterized protein n=1 Tax=Asanoa hainanensis TaxID=560556 RepID=A0A239LS45_9ACTN|nr:hypothetical protein SAMN05421812_104543 [Asanoa hainanensis]